MSETAIPSVSQIDLTHTNALLASGSPRSMYVFFLLSLCKNYFERMSSGEPDNIHNATGALIAFCPSASKQTELWEYYTSVKIESHDTIKASVFTVGKLIVFLNEVLEFSEDSTGGLL